EARAGCVSTTSRGWRRFGSVDAGVVPGAGVDVEGGGEAGVGGGGAGGGGVLVVEVGGGDGGGGEGSADEGFDHGGVDAHGDVAADAAFGPVPHRAEVQEVLEYTEAVLDRLQLSVGDHDLGGGGLVGGQRRDQHVAAGEQFLVGHRRLVVVVEEPTVGDLAVGQMPDPGGSQDGLSGGAEGAGVC